MVCRHVHQQVARRALQIPRSKSTQYRYSSTTASLQPPHPLTGLRCIITGASRGIGRAIATTFAKSGAQCLLIGRDVSALQSTKAACEDLTPTALVGHSHGYAVGDVSSRDFWTGLDISNLLPSPSSSSSATTTSSSSSSSNREDGQARIDVLINAAGQTHSSFLIRTSPSQIEAIIQTNLMGTLWGSQIIAKKMLSQSRKAKSSSSPSSPSSAKGGVIVNISSLLATHGGAGSAAYVASKAGVLGLTRSLAAELGPAGVRVNAVLPGYIETDMTEAMSSKAREEALAKIPAGRFGTVDEIADAVVFLATNAYANNCVINLDGGLSAV